MLLNRLYVEKNKIKSGVKIDYVGIFTTLTQPLAWAISKLSFVQFICISNCHCCCETVCGSSLPLHDLILLHPQYSLQVDPSMPVCHQGAQDLIQCQY